MHFKCLIYLLWKQKYDTLHAWMLYSVAIFSYFTLLYLRLHSRYYIFSYFFLFSISYHYYIFSYFLIPLYYIFSYLISRCKHRCFTQYQYFVIFSNPLIDVAQMQERMVGRRHVPLTTIPLHTRGGEMEGDWFTIAVLVSKSQPKTSQKVESMAWIFGYIAIVF